MFTYNPNLRFSLAEWIRLKKQEVMYLIVGPGDLFGKRLVDWGNIPLDEAFQKQVEHLVTAYVEKGEMPPEQVAPTILNLADDLVAGRNMVIRAGDYIALRSFMRKEKITKSK
jgi:hypothetical protein